jgi:thiamine-phosphate pyrophosphorylase
MDHASRLSHYQAGHPLMPNSHLSPLYVVTDRHQIGEEHFLEVLERLISQGGMMLQLREKDLPIRILLQWVHTLSSWAEQYQVPLLINDRVDVVMATSAHGVHLRGNSLPVRKARQCLGPNRLIGVSVHSADDAVQREQEGADFVVIGPIYDTPSKRAYGAPLGVSVLEEATRRCQIPIFAIGGIDLARLQDIRKTGAYGVAVISAIFQSSSCVETVKNFSTQLGVSS